MPNHFTLTFFCCEWRDVSCSHSNRDLFTCEDNMFFSHVKISCFRAKAHLVFHWCLYNNRCYQKLDHCITKFRGFVWLSDHGIFNNYSPRAKYGISEYSPRRGDRNRNHKINRQTAPALGGMSVFLITSTHCVFTHSWP